MRTQFQTGHHQTFHHAWTNIMFRPANLAAALGGQQHLMHDTQPGKRAIAIGQLDASADRQVRFGPGKAIAAAACADALQVGDETVGIRGSVFGVGRVVVAATREGDVLCVHGVCSVQRGRQRHRKRWRTVRGGKDREMLIPAGASAPTHRPPWNADGLPAGAARSDAGRQT